MSAQLSQGSHLQSGDPLVKFCGFTSPRIAIVLITKGLKSGNSIALRVREIKRGSHCSNTFHASLLPRSSVVFVLVCACNSGFRIYFAGIVSRKTCSRDGDSYPCGDLER